MVWVEERRIERSIKNKVIQHYQRVADAVWNTLE